MSRIMIALGGNALGDTPSEQRERIERACPALVDLIEDGNEIIVSHGNGPQVGMIALAFDTAHKTDEKVPEMPLAECIAMSQGYIGYHLQKGLLMELRRRHMPWQVATVVTQVVVDGEDPAFLNPTKPIGAFYDAETARRMMEEDPALRMKEDAGRGWRRLVPSPKPIEIVEDQSIRGLLEREFIVIACGGGGVPVVRDGKGELSGARAVIDKDFASAKLAEAVDADCLIILTAVDRVCIDYGTPKEKGLDRMTVAEAQAYMQEGQFAPGSMLPKVEAAVAFARSRGGRRAVIASLDKAALAVKGESGTTIAL